MTPTNGFTLLEVLISLLLLSIVLLGVEASQVVVMRETRGIYYFQQAAFFAEGMAEYLVAHRGDSSAYERKWQLQIVEKLPLAEGSVTSFQSEYTIKVVWGGMVGECHQSKQGVQGCVIINLSI